MALFLDFEYVKLLVLQNFIIDLLALLHLLDAAQSLVVCLYQFGPDLLNLGLQLGDLLLSLR